MRGRDEPALETLRHPLTTLDRASAIRTRNPPHPLKEPLGNRRAPTRPSPTNAPADARQPDTVRLAKDTNTHTFGEETFGSTTSAAVIVCDSGD